MNVLWTAEEVARATGGRLTRSGGAVGPIGGVSIDTRTLAPGDAFFAIRGDRLEGHAFVNEALARGAALAVVSDEGCVADPEAPVLVVPDVLGALCALGVAARERSRAKIVAVTGSVGKTGTKEALRLALGASGPVHASAASHNNHWGVPLTLARLPRSAAFGVFEIGMNHAGEITPLTRMVRPHVAIVTTVEPVHIGFFDSVEAIARAKAEIFSGLAPGGAAVVNADNPYAELLTEEAVRGGAARVVTFGTAASADVRLLALEPASAGAEIEASVFGGRVRYRLGQAGRHVAMNSLAVLAAVHLVGADVERGAAALASFAPARGRGRQVRLRLPGGEAVLLDEAYNANPASMRAALEVLKSIRPGEGGRRIAVLGDMLELGEHAETYHRDLAPAVLDASAEIVHTVGPLMRSLRGALPPGLAGSHRDGAADIVATVLAELRPGDVVVVKGSNGVGMSRIVDAIVERHALAAEAEA